MSIFQGFVIFCLFAGSSSYAGPQQAYEVDSCPEIETFPAFNPTRHMGIWYGNGEISSVIPQTKSCDTKIWTSLQNKASSILHVNMDTRTGNVNEDLMIINARDSSKPERFDTLFQHYNITGNYWILDTDYTSYSVHYSCNSDPAQEAHTLSSSKLSRYVQIMLMTRERNPPKAVIDKAMKFIGERGFDTSRYRKYNQSGCELLDQQTNIENYARFRSLNRQPWQRKSSSGKTELCSMVLRVLAEPMEMCEELY